MSTVIMREYLHVDTPYKSSITTSHCVERVGVCVMADSDAVLGSGDEKNLRSYSS